MELTYFEQIGEENLRKLIHDFYEGISGDDLLRPMYPMHLAPAEERLYLFMQQYLGGPREYEAQRGHPQLKKRHFPYPVDTQARERWMYHMNRAMEQNPMPEGVREFLKGYFADTANFLVNR